MLQNLWQRVSARLCHLVESLYPPFSKNHDPFYLSIFFGKDCQFVGISFACKSRSLIACLAKGIIRRFDMSRLERRVRGAGLSDQGRQGARHL